ncbi:MAG: M15 family metallopeptidase [Spirochaetales bacterium]|nr:M15 family metallopeptidase [Spirochaetales bacterium]
MMNTKQYLFFLVFLAFTIAACAAEEEVKLSFDREVFICGPGLTGEIICNVEPESGKSSFSKKTINRFLQEPEVTVSDSELKILSSKVEVEKDDIYSVITVLFPEGWLSGEKGLLNINWANEAASIQLEVKKNPADYIDSNGVIKDPASYDALINKKRSLPADYIPPDLVRVEVPTVLSFDEVNHLRKIASEALTVLVNTAKEEQGYEILARSGYRSYQTQETLFNSYVKNEGEEKARKFSAVPGTSEHQSGLAIDVTSPSVKYQLSQDYLKKPEGKWIADNAYRFGFIVRYQKEKEDITGYSYEPWHLRYVGKAAAAEIFTKGLCLEEFFEEQK